MILGLANLHKSHSSVEETSRVYPNKEHHKTLPVYCGKFIEPQISFEITSYSPHTMAYIKQGKFIEHHKTLQVSGRRQDAAGFAVATHSLAFKQLAL